MSQPRTPGLGSVLGGRYRLDQRVGRGGMADVFRARDELLHRIVAVKLFRPETGEEHDRLRFDAEMRTVAGLRHPGLVTLYDAGAGDASTDDAPFLVMEFVEGRTLRERLHDGPLPPLDVARLGAELAAALAYVHAQGIVHRDVKPANILLDTTAGTASARLTDFGIAQLGDGGQLTAHGTTVGTANYLSPEQALGRPLGPASDVYSLGLVLLEMLTGRLAYPGSGIDAAIARLHRQPDVPATFGPDWAALLSAMTAREPEQRPAAAQVRDTLTALADGTVPAAADARTTALAAPPAGSTQLLATPPDFTRALPLGEAPGAGTAGPRPRRRALLAVLAAVVAAAVVLGVVLANSGGGGTGTPSGTSTPVAEPTYPFVDGTLGQDLRTLEARVAAAPARDTRLRADTLTLARALSAGTDPTAALAAVDRDAMSTSLNAEEQAGLRSAITAIRADLSATAASSSAAASSAAAAARAAAASASAAARASAASASAASASAAAKRSSAAGPATPKNPGGGGPGRTKPGKKKPGKH